VSLFIQVAVGLSQGTVLQPESGYHTTPATPQRNSNQSHTTHEITQQISRKLLRMVVLTSETCWALNNEIIKQVTSSWSIFIQLSKILKFMFEGCKKGMQHNAECCYKMSVCPRSKKNHVKFWSTWLKVHCWCEGKTVERRRLRIRFSVWWEPISRENQNFTHYTIRRNCISWGIQRLLVRLAICPLFRNTKLVGK